MGDRLLPHEELGELHRDVHIDNIAVRATPRFFADGASSFGDWPAGADWSVVSGRFQGHHVGDTSDRYLTMHSSVDLSAYSDQELVVTWDQDESGRLESDDRLYFAFSGDGGSNWSSNIEAFRNDNPPSAFSYSIPSEYLAGNFRLRFYLNNSGGGGEYAYIDDIAIALGPGSGLKYPSNPSAENLRVLVEETARVNAVLFSGTQVTADQWHILETMDLPGYDTCERRWSYSAYYDATALVQQWITDGTIDSNGAGTYTLGHVAAANEENPAYSVSLYPSGQTGYPLATPASSPYPSRHNFCYGGWSLILIYSSQDTEGHRLYLYYDFLIEGWHNDPDFDDDGSPGGSISGFLMPEGIAGEGEAARVTVFAGEGDYGLSGDRMEVNGTSLSNGASPFTNVWNSNSPGLSVPGIDIDTFSISYPTLGPGDTRAAINLPTDSDGFIIYIILSFRSSVTTGDAISYLLEP